MPKTNLSMRKNDVRERDLQIIEMLRAGFSRQEVADKLQYADDSAITKAIERINKRFTAPAVEELRAQEDDRINAMLQSVWPKARRGDIQAIQTVLRLMERRAKYWGGLEAPKQLDLDVHNSQEERVAAALAALSEVEASEPEEA